MCTQEQRQYDPHKIYKHGTFNYTKKSGKPKLIENVNFAELEKVLTKNSKTSLHKFTYKISEHLGKTISHTTIKIMLNN